MWVCKCECGTIKDIYSMYLNSKNSVKSCGLLCKDNKTASIKEGDKFNRLTILSIPDREPWVKPTVECLCDCGKIIILSINSLVSNKTKSCGCIKIKNHKGVKFGKLTAINRLEKNGKYYWMCNCECGSTIEVRTDMLNRIKSCGCDRAEDYTGKIFGSITVLSLSNSKTADGKDVYLCKCDCGREWEVGKYCLRRMKSCGCDNTKSIESAKLRTREKHPNWNPNLTDEDRILTRNIRQDRECAKFVLKRDDYTCVICKTRGGPRMAAHHLDGFHWCKELRTEPSNLICLCAKCHNDFHSNKNYGKKYNTKAQFIQYAQLKGISIDEIEERLHNE